VVKSSLPKVPPALGGTFGGLEHEVSIDNLVRAVGEKQSRYKLRVSLDSVKQAMIKADRACHDPKRK